MGDKATLGELLQKVKDNDAGVTKLGGSALFDTKMVEAVAQALHSNTNLTELDFKGCNLGTPSAVSLAKALEVNSTLKKLNLESNKIEPAGIVAIAEALRKNTGLVELRLVNQHQSFGNNAEEKLAETMELYNVSLERLVVAIKNGGARVRINKFETRNREIGRRKRVGQDWSSLDPRTVHKEKLAAAGGAPASNGDAAPAADAAPASEEAPAE